MLIKLIAWKRAVELCDVVAGVIYKFPDIEKYNLTDQMRRSEDSIPSNIAEGAGRVSSAEKRRFYAIAYSSSNELRSQVELAKRRGYMAINDFNLIVNLLIKVQKLICGLYKNPAPKNFKP